MKSIDELTAFYVDAFTEGKGDLVKQSELIGNTLYQSVQKGLLVWLAAIIIAALVFSSSTLILFFILISAAVIGWLLNDQYKQAKQAFNERCYAEIFPKLVKFVDGNLHYAPARIVSQHIFTDAKFIPLPFNAYSGQDYLSGEYDGVHFEASTIVVKHQNESSNPVIKCLAQDKALFNGVLIRAEFEQANNSQVVILPKCKPDFDPEYLDAKCYARLERYHTKFAEFERSFAVLTSDPMLAKTLLSERFMLRVLSLQQKFGNNVYITVEKGHITIAVNGQHIFDRSRNIYFENFYADDVMSWYGDLMRVFTIFYDLGLTSRAS
ncbi:DUF3137 domain-containing protein [Zooshikella sp. RANM57]|uniref:DUF3137 domain-containing protein n=1 Tax=Zooshikella sp. RANM57 TaxID=3425863 RepID=UPI003D6DF075